MPSSGIREVLAQYSGWGLEGTSKPLLLRQLMGGLTNKSYLIALSNKYYVVRLFAKNTAQLSIDRDAEYAIANIASQHNLAPRPLYLCPDKNYSITAYAEGDLINQSSLPEADKINGLATALSSLHKLNPVSRLPILNVVVKAESYWRTIQKLSHACSFLKYKKTLQEYFSLLAATDDLVLCHNDLVAGNIIVTQAGLKFIDWEYAALADPYLDIASVIINYPLTDCYKNQFISCYGIVEPLRLQLAISQMHYLEWLWWLIQGQGSNPIVIKKLKALIALTE